MQTAANLPESLSIPSQKNGPEMYFFPLTLTNYGLNLHLLFLVSLVTLCIPVHLASLFSSQIPAGFLFYVL